MGDFIPSFMLHNLLHLTVSVNEFKVHSFSYSEQYVNPVLLPVLRDILISRAFRVIEVVVTSQFLTLGF